MMLHLLRKKQPNPAARLKKILSFDSYFCQPRHRDFSVTGCNFQHLTVYSNVKLNLKTDLRSITSANCGKSGGTWVKPALEHLTVFIIHRHPEGHLMSLCAVTFSQNDTAQIRPIILNAKILNRMIFNFFGILKDKKRPRWA